MSMSASARKRPGLCPSFCDICKKALCAKKINHHEPRNGGTHIHACESHKRTD
jgi:hypothetical protein